MMTQITPHYSTRQTGFTLIEIMVVVIILGILAAIVVPRVMDRPDAARVTGGAGSSMPLGSVGDLLRARKVVDALLRRLGCPEPTDPSPSSEESSRATPTRVLDHGVTVSPRRAAVEGSRCGTSDNGDHATGPDDHEGRASSADPRGEAL